MAGTRSAVNRRHFLLTSGSVAAGAGVAWAITGAAGPSSAAPVTAAAAPAGPRKNAGPVRLTGPAVVRRAAPYGTTTLESTARLQGSGAYRRIGAGPGWPSAVRTELAAADSRRTGRRVPLACFVQFTDLHIADVQHPLRTEFLRAGSPGSWRVQEALSAQGAVALVEQANALRAGPHTGLRPAFVISTGDNADNNAAIELEWFLTAMSGGRITPNTGDPGRYEGVQDSGLALFWQAEAALRDQDKQRGLPRVPGYLSAATAPLTSPGLDIPWYSTPGNHDALPGGCIAPQDPELHDLAVGARKLLTVPDTDVAAYRKVLVSGADPKSAVLKDILRRNAAGARTVTPDPRRRMITPHDYLTAHLDPAYAGHGPAGHGFTEDNLDGDRMYYAFEVAPGVLGISLDTTYRSGHLEGSLGTDQLRWLERTLTAHSSRYYDTDGRAVTHSGADDAHVLVFSHHHSPSMTRRPDATDEDKQRHDGQEVIALLSRFPNVVAWINGHSHVNKITAHGHAVAARSFWEVNTASHVDYPHHARLFELADNQDGTVSLFTTLIESAAPYRADAADLSSVGLASLYRELSYNAPGLAATLGGGVKESSAGARQDRNTELLLRRA
ncbi:TIGR03767 family metallophosphoesterase [Streptomyces sp. V4-01]|uniref:TIGR03767 family metallophosphoesterase n=1 Tax=Actinacidiphila polyblastidii TaxID=3110430 RepID=A0ABU7P7H9_9ACTN|nr:TIGR03767 family metallophosphoesterase [Streptomyces sp. V4-01]